MASATTLHSYLHFSGVDCNGLPINNTQHPYYFRFPMIFLPRWATAELLAAQAITELSGSVEGNPSLAAMEITDSETSRNPLTFPLRRLIDPDFQKCSSIGKCTGPFPQHPETSDDVMRVVRDGEKSMHVDDDDDDSSVAIVPNSVISDLDDADVTFTSRMSVKRKSHDYEQELDESSALDMMGGYVPHFEVGRRSGQDQGDSESEDGGSFVQTTLPVDDCFSFTDYKPRCSSFSPASWVSNKSSGGNGKIMEESGGNVKNGDVTRKKTSSSSMIPRHRDHTDRSKNSNTRQIKDYSPLMVMNERGKGLIESRVESPLKVQSVEMPSISSLGFPLSSNNANQYRNSESAPRSSLNHRQSDFPRFFHRLPNSDILSQKKEKVTPLKTSARSQRKLKTQMDKICDGKFGSLSILQSYYKKLRADKSKVDSHLQAESRFKTDSHFKAGSHFEAAPQFKAGSHCRDAALDLTTTNRPSDNSDDIPTRLPFSSPLSTSPRYLPLPPHLSSRNYENKSPNDVMKCADDVTKSRDDERCRRLTKDESHRMTSHLVTSPTPANESRGGTAIPDNRLPLKKRKLNQTTPGDRNEIVNPV